MNNQHKKIKRYRDLSQGEIDAMNELKELSEQCGRVIERLQRQVGNSKQTWTVAQRELALGKTNLQQGFMWAIRSIAQPGSF